VNPNGIWFSAFMDDSVTRPDEVSDALPPNGSVASGVHDPAMMWNGLSRPLTAGV